MILKKIAAIALIASMSLAFSSCDMKKGGSSKDVVSWYMIKPLENMSSQELVEEEANKIISKQVDASLKFNLIEGGAWNEKMNIIIASGEVFDLCLTSSSGPTSIITNVKRGAFLDVTQLLDKYGSDIKAKNDPRAWDAVKYDGKIMAIPSQGKYVPETAYVFKKDLVDKYKFDYKSVKNLADLEPFLETLKQNEPNIIPLYITANSDVSEPVDTKYTATEISTIYFDEEQEKFVNSLEVRKDEFKLKNKYFQKGYIAKDAFTKQDASEGQSGKYAVMRDTGAYTADGSKSSAYYGFPCVETLVGTGLIPQHNIMNGNAISVTSKHPDKVMQVLNLVWKDPYLSNTLAYGIKDVNYTVKSKEGAKDMSVLPASGSDQTWAVWHNWIGPLFDQWDSTWNTKESLEQMKSANKTGKLSKTVGFMVDIEPIKAEIAALSEIYNAAYQILQIGNMENFDDYMSKLYAKQKSAGLDKVLDEFNKQYKEQMK